MVEIVLTRGHGLAGLLAAGSLVAGMWSGTARADDLAIGFITPLSTPAGHIGEDIFRLTVDDGGKRAVVSPGATT